MTLHQQKGANSTLKMIFEQLQAEWERQTQAIEKHTQAATLNNNGDGPSEGGSISSEFSLIAKPMPMVQKAHRGAAI